MSEPDHDHDHDHAEITLSSRPQYYEIMETAVRELLIEKKRRYGDFIVNTQRALTLMKSDRSRSVTDRCPFAEKSFALGPDGNMKEPCMLGPKADCDRCGCVVPFYLKSLTDRRLVVSDLAAALGTKARNMFLRGTS